MGQIRTGHFEADGGAHNLDLGFVPSYIKIFNQSAATGEVQQIECFVTEMADLAEFHTTIIVDNGSTANANVAYTASGSVSEYNTTAVTDSASLVSVNGFQGITLAAAFMDDSDEIWYVAMLADQDVDGGDIV